MANTKKDEQMSTADNKESNKERAWIVKVTNNPEYCGVGAGGTQFARGEATVKSERMALWFKEHKGYTVTEQQ